MAKLVIGKSNNKLLYLGKNKVYFSLSVAQNPSMQSFLYSSDYYILKDSNGIYLRAKEEN